jgi:glycosyltransferase involved in cell wall biosynthesis
MRPAIGRLPNRLMVTRNPILHSAAVLPSAWPGKINSSDAAVAHLNWVNLEMMSVEDIGRVRKPIVWTLHDMWAFCGAEHVTDDFRWREGYTSSNRPVNESGFDLNRWVWQRKYKSWRRPMHIVAPSNWLADCVRQSALMRDWPVSVVHNPIDTDTWQPIDKHIARRLMGLPASGPLLLFGTFGENSAPHKGFDLLRSALQCLRGQVDDLRLVVFGQFPPRVPEDMGFPVHYVGHLHDDLSLRVLYSAADAVVIPSRQENLPNTGLESLASGTPVVAFDTCGLPDVVRHKETGYLAKPFEAEDLAEGVRWVLEDRDRYARLCSCARADAVARFSYPVVAQQYLKVYEAAMGANGL